MNFALAPLHCRSLQLTEQGLVLGDGVVVAPLERRWDGICVLALEGRDAEIFALLSLAQGRAISPNILHGLRGVAKSFAQGDAVGAAFRLALLGLPPLRGPRDAEMLKTGATFLARGVSPWTILRAAGIEGPNVELYKAEWNPDLHPRDSANGRFVETGGQASSEGAKQNGEVGAKPPDSRNAWSSAIDAANHWLQTPVPGV
jgi:hypothetical protein